ncbi:hypothetical protein GCM10010172_24690 [Paractinoplanes ferrugineus]|uniref:PPE family protein n=1 Tax=Paractinoplanes ferrugineus TaxID=113564 RepID=A0A919IT90_9ACTN|nr:hypothetical protein [Actinoplanes ferrugineus]GIE08621.1 hypothetical protein Afe05nite_04610 [Actinoplanes ferrugineus]
MIDAGGGGGGTPWESLTIEQMQTLIQNPDTQKQWDIGDGWKKSAELVSEHLWQVRNYRDNLATAWSPKKSSAAKVYIDRLNNLISDLEDTYEAALANHEAISSATGSIYQAQVKMDAIYKEYKSNEQLLANPTQQKSVTPTPSPSPSGAEPSGVASNRQEELRVQAARMLSSVSTDLAQAQVKIVTPRPYTGKYVNEDTRANPGDYNPPPIPPITPTSAFDSGSSTPSTNRPSTSFPASAANTAVSSHLVPSPSATTPPAVATPQPGLVLGGTGPTQLPPTAPTINPVTPGLPGGGPVTGPGLMPPNSTFLPNGGSTPTGMPTTPGVGRGGILPREATPRGGGGFPEGTRAMPSGGVIGQTPTGALGNPGANRSGVGRRVNPIGGVIGEGGSGLGARRGVSGTSGLSPTGQASSMYPQGGSRRSAQREETDGTRWDPDNPWETDEGVDPVVLPSREQRIDPGPAIGLG